MGLTAARSGILSLRSGVRPAKAQAHQGLEETLEEEPTWNLRVFRSDDENSSFSVDLE
jgi:hypothetical protein